MRLRRFGMPVAGFKVQLGNAAQAQPLRQLVPQVMPGMLERRQRLASVPARRLGSQPDVRMAAIGRHVDFERLPPPAGADRAISKPMISIELLPHGFGDA